MVIARGLVNYDSDELPALLGRSTTSWLLNWAPAMTVRFTAMRWW